ncbi:MAG: hypothetical protein QOE65_1272 [Solirubrobacteraceae bacterium]|jgi:predicted acylesterase/phospholipase RssA|nr:hypothetical protein [Solirubrobacteraceae bacterium]
MRDVVRVLSIDGGGIRGIIPARVLVELERIAERPIAELFDIVAGTSTGGLIALAAAKPDAAGRPAMSAQDILAVYLQDGETMFPDLTPRKLVRRVAWQASKQHVYQRAGALVWPGRFGNARYLAADIEGVLERTLGDTRLSEALVDVVVPTYDWRAGRALLFTSYDARAQPTRDLLMRDVARGTTAAPTYFPPLQMTLPDGREVALIDGGVVANNPVSVAYYEALRHETESPREVDVMSVSLGTGRPPEEVPTYEELWSRSWLRLGMGMLGTVFDGTSEIAEELMRSISACREPRSRFWRFQAELHGCSLAMDDATPRNMNALLGLAERMIVDQRAELEEIARVLTAPDPQPADRLAS